MGKQVVVSLVNKYARLLGEHRMLDKMIFDLEIDAPSSGELLRHKARRERVRADLSHLAESIRVFEPRWNPKQVKPIGYVRRFGLPRGFWPTHALNILRKTDTPRSARELVNQICAEEDLDVPKRYQDIATSSIATSLKRNPLISVVEGHPRKWIIRKF